MFVELMPLLNDRTLLLTVATVEGKVRVNVIPAKAKEGEDQARTTPLPNREEQPVPAECGQSLELTQANLSHFNGPLY